MRRPPLIIETTSLTPTLTPDPEFNHDMHEKLLIHRSDTLTTMVLRSSSTTPPEKDTHTDICAASGR